MPLNSDVVETGLVHRKGAALLRLVVAVGALFPLYADVVLVGLMLREVAVRLRLVGTVSTLRRGCACWPCAP